MNRKNNAGSRRIRNQRRIAFMELGTKADKVALPHQLSVELGQFHHHYKPRQSEQ